MGEYLVGAKILYTNRTPHPSYRGKTGVIVRLGNDGVWDVELDDPSGVPKRKLFLTREKLDRYVDIISTPYTEEDIEDAVRELDQILGACSE